MGAWKKPGRNASFPEAYFRGSPKVQTKHPRARLLSFEVTPIHADLTTQNTENLRGTQFVVVPVSGQRYAISKLDERTLWTNFL